MEIGDIAFFPTECCSPLKQAQAQAQTQTQKQSHEITQTLAENCVPAGPHHS